MVHANHTIIRVPFILTSCKMLRSCNSCCLQYNTSWIIEFRKVLSNMNRWSSGAPLAIPLPYWDEGRDVDRRLPKLSIDRGLSEPALLSGPWFRRDRFNRRVARAGSWDLTGQIKVALVVIRIDFIRLCLLGSIRESWHIGIVKITNDSSTKKTKNKNNKYETNRITCSQCVQFWHC